MKKFLLLGVGIAFVLIGSAQTTTGWTAQIKSQQLFIENKGQFNNRNNQANEPVLFATEDNQSQIFFSKSGVTYRFEKVVVKEKDEINEEEEPDGAQTDIIQMHWLNANPNVGVEGDEAGEGYFNFTNASHARGFKRLVYRNLYNGIDVQYIFHPQGGVEYSFILQPGADMAQVKMSYESASVKIQNAEIHIATMYGDIVDHAPKSFYADGALEDIASTFVLQGKTVSFQLAVYDNSRALVVDPWTVTPSFPNMHKAYYIKRDSHDNAYVYGGDVPYKLIKYSPTGSLLWSFSTPWDSSTSWFGTLAVDPIGNAYLTSGSLAAIAKVDSAGNAVWLATPAMNAQMEYWALAFNCDYTQLLAGGAKISLVLGTPTMAGIICNINLANGLSTDTIKVANFTIDTSTGFNGSTFVLNNPNEVRSMCFGPDGNYYFVTRDTVGKMDTARQIQYRTLSNHKYSYYLPYGQGLGQGQNSICASSTYFYTTNGKVLLKHDLNSGLTLSSVQIPYGHTELNSGLAADNCGNIYAGSTGRVFKYDANLNIVDSVTVQDTVYDVAVSGNGNILVCGKNFASSVFLSACNPIIGCSAPPLSATVTAHATTCADSCNGWAQANVSFGHAPYSFAWSSGSSTNASDAALCQGAYTLTVTDSTGQSVSVAFNITSVPSMAVHDSVLQPTCGQNNGWAGAMVTGGNAPYSYSWNTGGSNNYISNIDSGVYYLTIRDHAGCVAIDTFTVGCHINLSITPSHTDAGCNGACNGSAQVLASGVPPYVYAWSNGANGFADVNLCAGSYSVTVTDSLNNTASASFNIAQLVDVTISETSTNSILDSSSGSASVTVLTGTAPYTYLWNNGDTTSTILNIAGGNYSVTVTGANGCSVTAAVLVNTDTIPTATFNLWCPIGTVNTLNECLLCINIAATYTNADSIVWQITDMLQTVDTSISNLDSITLSIDSSCVTDSNHVLILSGAISRSLDPIIVCLTAYSNCCSASYCDTLYLFATQINELAASGISIYPNPASTDGWQMDITNDYIGAQLSLYNAEGQRVYETKIVKQHTTLNPGVAAGIYLAKVVLGGRTTVKKLIKM